MIYLDHNATTAIKPKAAEAMMEVMAKSPLNPSSVHASGRAARKMIEDARGKITSVFGAEGANVIFTSGGTEANNLAIRGVKGFRIIVSSIEHSSVLKAAKDCFVLPVESNGIVSLTALEKMLKNFTGKAMVSVMLANNETGIIQPIREIANLIHSCDGILHVDAVQAAGKIPVNMRELGADIITISAHKFGGPQGVGALIIKKGIAISSIITGGGQELGLRAGTENVAGIIGFAVAAELINLENAVEIKTLRDYMEKKIAAKIFGQDAERLPNTSCIAMPGVKAEVQLIEFDLAGIAISSGSACSSGKVAASHVLEAMGIKKEEAETAIRVSLGQANTKAEIDKFIEIWKALEARAGNKASIAA